MPSFPDWPTHLPVRVDNIRQWSDSEVLGAWRGLAESPDFRSLPQDYRAHRKDLLEEIRQEAIRRKVVLA